jgi:uncharacterized protein YllA (UPF0747 family)
VLRNSFLLVDEKSDALINKLQLSNEAIFQPEFDLMNMLVKRESAHQLSLENEKLKLAEVYEQLKEIAGKVDVTLSAHTAALHTKSQQRIEILEKKMLRAEKEKFEAQQRQLHKLKTQLFPNNNLQERVENFMLQYAKSGKVFIDSIYQNSLSLEQEFVILTEK